MVGRAGAASVWFALVSCTTDGATSTSIEPTSTSAAETTTSDESTSSSSEGSSETSGESTSTGADESSTGDATCPLVANGYYVAYAPTRGNTCEEILGATSSCTATQTDCELKWYCDGALENLLPDGPIDANGVYIGDGAYMGTPVTCTLAFTVDPLAFEFACIGRDLECTGSGF